MTESSHTHLADLRATRVGYISAILSVVVATAARKMLDPALGNHLPFVTYFIAIMFSAWYSGRWPSWLALGLGCLAADYFFVPPRGTFAVIGIPNKVGIGLYFFVGVASILLSDAHRAAVRRSQRSERDLVGRQKALEQEIAVSKRLEERYKTIIKTAMDGFWLVDTQGRILDVNDAYGKLTGYSWEELQTMSITDIEAAETAEATARHIQQIKETGGDRFETRHRCKDGKIIDIEVSANYQETEGGRFFVFLRDITKRKLAEEEIKRLNAGLEHLVRDRTALLEASNKELEAFSYSVSHDLRAPLRAIDGFSHMLLDDYTDKLDAEGRRRLDVIRSSTQKMGQLIDDLLAFSRMGRREITQSDIDMAGLARAVGEELRTAIPERILQFTVNTLPPARGDQSMVRQVFANLLSNAVKFTRPREAAIIEVGGRADEGENVYYVRDNGVGFDMQYVNKLFGVFSRLHSVEEFEGTGVGLALVQRIIHRHGGRVWAEGKVNEGATFYFTLTRGK